MSRCWYGAWLGSANRSSFAMVLIAAGEGRSMKINVRCSELKR